MLLARLPVFCWQWQLNLCITASVNFAADFLYQDNHFSPGSITLLGGKGWLLGAPQQCSSEPWDIDICKMPQRCCFVQQSFPAGLISSFPAVTMLQWYLQPSASLLCWLIAKFVFMYSDKAIKLYNYTLLCCKLHISRETKKQSEIYCLYHTSAHGGKKFAWAGFKCILTECFFIKMVHINYQFPILC